MKIIALERQGSEVVISKFSYGAQPVRVEVIDGEPWFIAVDVCGVLDIKQPHRSLAALDSDEKGRHTMTTPGGDQLFSVVSESGLYSLILRSRKPEAKLFKRWITHEVLPTIRKTGGAYIQPGSQAEVDLADPDTALDKLIEIAHVAKAERAKRIEAEAKTTELQAQAAIDAPKVAAYEQFMDSDGSYSIGTVGKILGIGQNRLFQMLRDKNVLISWGGMKNTPYQEYAHHFKVVAGSYQRGDIIGTSRVTKVKPSGLEFIAKKVGKILPAVNELELVNA
ncbi:phage antirepressor KilAC domain-containing protein [Mycobacteroides abscessus]|uniref:phage antirepressor KilAC domain-containing protein n=1 Tax=Mycobacteroides abscessus TaxID=36809 RepID=UPI000697EFB1|nr:phage antirepressor KilAC domain-containing protein [Mycobacteroides abscessus]